MMTNASTNFHLLSNRLIFLRFAGLAIPVAITPAKPFDCFIHQGRFRPTQNHKRRKL
jgi:hypothetical protein